MTPDPEEEVSFMQSPGEWPMWPILPMKNRDGRVGIMAEVNGHVQPIVWEGNIYEIQGKGLNELPSERFIDFYGVSDAGWMVD